MTEKTQTPPTPPTARSNETRPQPGKSWSGTIVAVAAVVVVGIGLAWWAINHKATAPSQGARPIEHRRGRAAEPCGSRWSIPAEGGSAGPSISPEWSTPSTRPTSTPSCPAISSVRRWTSATWSRRASVLAEIDIPELFKSADQAKAALEQAKAKLKQAEARVVTAQADRESAAAQVQQALDDVARYTANRDFRKKELDRITGLFNRQAVAGELVDEQQRQYEAALASRAVGPGGGRDVPGPAFRGGGARRAGQGRRRVGQSRRRCGRGRPGQGRGLARIHQDHLAL